MADVDRAIRALQDGELIVFPTETVYGLGADARESSAVADVYRAKSRDPAEPVSIALPDVDTARQYVALTDRAKAFATTFLPGPITLLCEPGVDLPDPLSGPDGKVGLRIPDCHRALTLLERVDRPITATSANVSGRPNATTVDQIDTAIADNVSVVVDGGQLPGGESTVVDVDRGDIIREGLAVESVRRWLAGR